MSQECHKRASRHDSEHITTKQYPNCVNYMVTIPLYCIRVGSILVWCNMAVCTLYIKALYSYVTRVLMKVTMNFTYAGCLRYRFKP